MNTLPRQRRLGTFAAAALFVAALVLLAPSMSQAKQQGNQGNQALTQTVDQLAKLVSQNPGMRGRNFDMVLLHLIEDLIRMEEHRHHHHHHHHHGFGQGLAQALNGGGQPVVGAGQQTGRQLAKNGKKVWRVVEEIIVIRKGGAAGALAGHHKHHKHQATRNALAGGFGKGVGNVAINVGAPKVKQGVKVGCAAGANHAKAKGKAAVVANNNTPRPGKAAKQVALAGAAGAAVGKGNGGRVGNKGRGGKK